MTFVIGTLMVKIVGTTNDMKECKQWSQCKVREFPYVLRTRLRIAFLYFVKFYIRLKSFSIIVQGLLYIE